MRRGGIGYIGAVIDHNEFSNSIVVEDEEGEDNCPACEKAGYGSKLSRKIIYVEQTKRGPKISKNPIIALGLDTDKQYCQCPECGNIYDLKDLPTTLMQDPDREQAEINRAYREGDFIPGSGPGIINVKSKNKNKIKKPIREQGTSEDSRDKDKPKPKGKIISKQIQRTKVKIVKKIPENVPEKGNT